MKKKCFSVGFCVFLTVLAPMRILADKQSPYLRLIGQSERLAQALQSSLCPDCSNSKRIIPQLKIPSLIKTQDPSSTADAVRNLGDYAGIAIGQILPVRASLETFQALSQRLEVLQIEVRPPRQLFLDKSRIDIRADLVEKAFQLPIPLTGKGVTVGLVDTGIDFDHPDFGTKTSRVLEIWDLTFDSGEPPPGQSRGSLCDSTEIQKSSCKSIDIFGHGTHVAGTMIGSGNTYRGMAPEAEIITVAASMGEFDLLIESVSWLFSEAQKYNKPMVVNLSLGDQYGPHDGTDLQAKALSDLTGPGRIIVAAAGNDGGNCIHLGYDPQGSTGKTSFKVYGGLLANSALLTLWTRQESILSFSIGIMKNSIELTETDWIAIDGVSYQLELSDGATLLAKAYFEPAGKPNPDNQKFQMDIAIEPSSVVLENPDEYVFYLKAKGTGFFDAWSIVTSGLSPPALFNCVPKEGEIPGDAFKTIASPAVGENIIAVASYATRNSWVDSKGITQDHSETEVGNISYFSSRGPSADPEKTGHKPDVAAPGEFIIAAFSKNSPELILGTKIDDLHVVMEGTSMACPHVAGVVALLLQANPQLTPSQVKEILRSTARQDDFTGSNLPDPVWGYGKLDAFEASARVLGVGICANDADCADGYDCGKESRCQPSEESGCTCATGSSPRVGILFFLLILLRLTLFSKAIRPQPNAAQPQTN